MSNLFDVSGKVIAITGGGGILCGTMARALGEGGAKVAVLDLSEAAATQRRRGNQGQGRHGHRRGVQRAGQGQHRAGPEDKVIAEFGRVDALINGAGGNKKEATTSPEMPFFDLPPEAIRFVFDLNFLGTLLPSQVFGKADGPSEARA